MSAPVLTAAVPSEASANAVPESSAAKVLALLDAFRGPKAILGVSELAMSAGLSKSTAHRLLAIMAQSGYIERSGTRYCLSARSFEVGAKAGGAVPALALRRRAMPYLSELFARTRETIHLAMLSEEGEVLLLEKVYGHHGAASMTAVGMRLPAHATALGKSMLAHGNLMAREALLEKPLARLSQRTIARPDVLVSELMRVKERGYATSRGEFRADTLCIAVPVIDPYSGSAVAAISLSSFREQGIMNQLPLLRDVASSLAQFRGV